MIINLSDTEMILVDLGEKRPRLIIDNHTQTIYDLSKCVKHPELGECACELNGLPGSYEGCSGKVYTW